jgi:SAM-dependent methyltransferase
MAKYNDPFFDYVDAGAIRSASVVVPLVYSMLKPASVLDVGCGRGGWLRAWKNAGAASIQGVDGDYVDRSRLYIDLGSFRPTDVSQPFDLARRFDLVQCLEVAEHIPAARAEGLIDSITRHGDVVLFAAAVPGQGGTGHINEQPLEYWRGLFNARGYATFDPLRPQIHADPRIELWYRYNTLVYANDAGQARLPAAVSATLVAQGAALKDYGTLSWKLRKAVLRHLPVSIVDEAAAINAKLHRILRSPS